MTTYYYQVTISLAEIMLRIYKPHSWFFVIQNEGDLIAFCYEYVKILSAEKVWFPSSVGKTSTLELKTALIAFQALTGHHTGKLLAETILGLLNRAHATNKVNTTAQYQPLQVT